MARLIGCITTSHVPSIGHAIRDNQQQDPYWKPFFDAHIPVNKWLRETQPDLVLMVYNDHGLNFFLNNRPTFAIGAAPEYWPGDEGFGPPKPRCWKGNADFSWHLIESLIADELDVASCQEMQMDHAWTLAGDLLWPSGEAWPVPVVPVEINIMQHPLPSFRRCYKLGQAIGRAIQSYPQDLKVVVIGSGGLSHQINQGGHINEEFDRMCMDKIVTDPEALLGYTNEQWVDLAGSQGLEFATWVVMRGAIKGVPKVLAQTYHQPLSHTGGAVMLLEPHSAMYDSVEI